MKKKAQSILLALALILNLCSGFLLTVGAEGTPLDGEDSAPAAITCESIAQNIAQGYKTEMDTANYPWVVADLVAANTVGVYGKNAEENPITYELSDIEKQAYVDYAIGELAKENVSTSVLAKNIIGLSALGYDARYLTTANRTALNAVEKLTAKVNVDTSIYSTPWMLLALQQYAGAYEAEKTALVGSIVAAAEQNQWWYAYDEVTYFDAAASAFLALAPYYNQAGYEAVTSAVNEAKIKIQADISQNKADTSADGTAALITGLTALGENARSFQGKDLITGLLAKVDASGTGFLSGYTGNLDKMSTEQGFRGLISAAGYAKNTGAYRLYDFSGKTLAPAAATWATGCPVYLSVIPSGSAIELRDGEGKVVTPTAIAGAYHLSAGGYTYTISQEGYQSKSGSLTVSTEEAAEHSRKDLQVSLASKPVSSEITVKVSVKTHDPSDCHNSFTYKENAASYSDITVETVKLGAGSTVFDALDAALSAAGIAYEERSRGYIASINGISELDHGPYSGWLYRVNGTTATIGCRDYSLQSNATIVWFYSDDYTREYGSETWNPKPKDPSVTVTADKSGSASITAKELKTASEEKGTLSVETAAGSLAFTEEGTASLAAMLGGSATLSLAMTKTDPSKSQFTVVSHEKVLAALDISVMAGSTKITQNFGSLTIKLPLDQRFANQSLSILHLKADGQYEILSGKADAKGELSFETTSLSTFVVFSKGEVPVYYTFSDVERGAWYESYLQAVYERGIMSGVTKTSFAPNTVMSRAMLVTVLYRMDGAGSDNAGQAFTDVSDPTAWYYDAVQWAARNRIVSGFGNGSFEPNANITREQMVTIFYRYAAYKSYQTSQTGSLQSYLDAKDVSSWATPAFGWAISKGIVSGTSSTSLAPAKTATRSEAAAIIVRFLEKANAQENQLQAAYKRTASYYLNSTGTPGYGSEWAVIGLCKGGYPLPQGLKAGYYDSVCKYVEECKGVLSQRKYTEYSRVIHGLSAAGYDAKNVVGYDLTEALGDYEATIYQGINGPIWALIALNSGSYPNKQEQQYLDYILAHELESGGWALSGTKADPDMTAMALRALKPYQSNETVLKAIERGLAVLSQLQGSDGGYSSSGLANSESCGQVILALKELGISFNDPRFVKNGHKLDDKFLSYQLENGSFEHEKGGGANGLATEQALYALAAMQ